MSLNFTLDDFNNFELDVNFSNSPTFEALKGATSFRDEGDRLAIIGFGGTFSSHYSPSDETIYASGNNPLADLIVDLRKAFGVASSDFDFISLCTKDSRDITKDDVDLAIIFVNSIQNRRVVFTCGTYGLPLLTQILGQHVKANKIVGVTGSMAISALREQDVEFNAGCVLSAVNMAAQLIKDQPHVFAAFHGEIIPANKCDKLDLHPESHRRVQIYRHTPIGTTGS